MKGLRWPLKPSCGRSYGCWKFRTKPRTMYGEHAVTFCLQNKTWCSALSSQTPCVISANSSLRQCYMQCGCVPSWMRSRQIQFNGVFTVTGGFWISKNCSHGWYKNRGMPSYSQWRCGRFGLRGTKLDSTSHKARCLRLLPQQKQDWTSSVQPNLLQVLLSAAHVLPGSPLLVICTKSTMMQPLSSKKENLG